MWFTHVEIFKTIGAVVEPNHITEFWQKAPWTKTYSGDVLSLGVNQSAPGVFRVEKGGLYLLYLNLSTFSLNR
jgi:hypothetical protein